MQVHTADLRRDYAAEAIRQGVDPERVAKIVNLIDFSIHGTDDPKEVAKYPIEAVSVKKGRLLCELNPALIIHLATNGSKHYDAAVYAPDEVRYGVLPQAFDAFWRHGRQHMIQNSTEEGEYRADVEENKYNTLQSLADGSIMAGLAVTGIAGAIRLADFYVNTDVIPKVPILAVGIGLTVAGLKGGDRVNYHRFHTSSIEKEAYAQMQPEHHTRRSPFKITFES